MLERGGVRFLEAVRPKAGLADMAAFGGGSPDTASVAPGLDADVPRGAAFNSKVLYALHSGGVLDPCGYTSRSVALIAALMARGVVPVITTRPGYPWNLAHHRVSPKGGGIEYLGLRFQLVPRPRATLRDPESRSIEAYSGRLQALATANDEAPVCQFLPCTGVCGRRVRIQVAVADAACCAVELQLRTLDRSWNAAACHRCRSRSGA